MNVAARSLGIQLEVFNASSPEELVGAFAEINRRRADGLVVLPDGMFWAVRADIVRLAAKARVPAIYWERAYAEAGGLLSYAASLSDIARRGAALVDKILKGAKPANLPVRAAHELRVRDQQEDRQGPRPYHPVVAAAASGPCDRVIGRAWLGSNPLSPTNDKNLAYPPLEAYMTDQKNPLSEYLVISRGQWDKDLSREEIQNAIDKFYVWYDRLVNEGRIRAGQRLARERKIVSKHVVTDGPFTETKEVIGGYWFILAGSLEQAAELAAENPCLACGLTYEIRPIESERGSAFKLTNETPGVTTLKHDR